MWFVCSLQTCIGVSLKRAGCYPETSGMHPAFCVYRKPDITTIINGKHNHIAGEFT